MMVDYTWQRQTQSTYQPQSMSMDIPVKAFGALYETMLKENLRDEVNKVMEEADKDKVMTASDVYRECADELRWLVNSLDKAMDCLVSGETIAGAIRLQRVLSRMEEIERKWWKMAEETEGSDDRP